MQFAQSQGRGVDDFEFTYIGRVIVPTLSPRALEDLDFSPEHFHPLCVLALLPREISAERRAAGDGSLTIRLRDQSGEETSIKMKRYVRMGILMRVYGDRKGISLKSLVFRLDGERVDSHTTPRRLGLEDQDQIDVILEQIGC
jgi:small ubiquitin-related modifier